MAKITGIPAFVCPVCGERVFRASVALRVDELKQRLDKPDTFEFVHVIRYPQRLVSFTGGHVEPSVESTAVRSLRIG